MSIIHESWKKKYYQILTIRTRLFLRYTWSFPQKVVQGGSMSSQRVIRRHKPTQKHCELNQIGLSNNLIYAVKTKMQWHLLVIDERIHQKPLLYKTLPLRTFSLQISVSVVGNNDAVGFVCQLHDKTVIIANHSFSCHPSGWCEHQELPPL